MRVIARRGMAEATIQEIAEEAGIAKGTIYLYFRDRDELVQKTFERVISELSKRVDTALATEQPFEQTLRAVLAAEIAFFREHREFFRLYISLRHPVGRHKRACASRYRARIERMSAVLQRAMDRGEIRRMDPFRLALWIVEGSDAVVLERVLEENPPAEQADVDLIAGAILEGIRP